MTAHGRGLVIAGRGPATGTVTVTGTSRTILAVPDATSGFTVHLTPGAYILTGSVPDGSCSPLPLVVKSRAPITVNLSCQDGYSTF
jgi:hypothetical protein